jgi:hypothetical protein
MSLSVGYAEMMITVECWKHPTEIALLQRSQQNKFADKACGR